MHREGWKENESIVGIIEENEAGGDLKENMLIPKAPHGILAGILDCSKLLSKNWSSTTSSLENHKQTTLQQLQSITLHNPIYLESIITDVTAIMSLFGYGARPQPSSAEKIAAAEQEMDLVTDMFNKYVLVLYSSS